MKKIIYVTVAVLALGLAGFTGCDGDKSAAPSSDNRAWCKTNHNTADACNADARCRWKLADADNDKDRCVGK